MSRRRGARPLVISAGIGGPPLPWLLGTAAERVGWQERLHPSNRLRRVYAMLFPALLLPALWANPAWAQSAGGE